MAERLVVIGGNPAGMAAATNARRGRPDLEIVAIERGSHTSYSSCGLPYVVGGAVGSIDDLVVRTPREFRDLHRIDVRLRHEVVGIDLDARRVEIRALDQDRTLHLGFDLLHLATGARPVRPDLPGIDEPWVHGVQTIDDTTRLLRAVEEQRCRRVVVVGSGYIGLELAEAFVDRGIEVTLVEAASQPLASIDPDLGAQVAAVLRGYGVGVRLGVRATGFEDHQVLTTEGPLPADLVVLGMGVRPASEVGLDAGLAAGANGAIAVDHRQRTSAGGIYAAGDCADTYHLVSRSRVHIALGTVANKTARIAGTNLGGGYATFPGVLGTALTRVCQFEVGRTGLNQAQAHAAGLEFVVGTAQGTSRAGYFPGAVDVTARVLAERGTGRVLGGQVLGGDRVGKRIDTLATAITAGFTASQVVDLDLGYAPAVSTLWDPVQVAAQEAAALAVRTGRP